MFWPCHLSWKYTGHGRVLQSATVSVILTLGEGTLTCRVLTPQANESDPLHGSATAPVYKQEAVPWVWGVRRKKEGRAASSEFPFLHLDLEASLNLPI